MSDAPVLELHPTETVSRFIWATIQPIKNLESEWIREIALFGPRGEGKTWAALTAMLAHAQRHHAAGYPLPVKWLGATSTFQSHKDKTHDSVMAAGWRGLWDLRDQGHQALFTLNGAVLVDLRLFGVDDPRGMERLRAETHCVWFEEAAPAEELGSVGMSENHWGMALTSMRLPSYRNVAIATQNYPDEEHWTWTRFVRDEYPGTAYFRIPKGERATPEQRKQWAEAIRDPVMRQRLIEGQPGTLIPGRPVAEGFDESVHVARHRLVPREGATIWLGQDGGLSPATVIAQRAGARIEILAALVSQKAGIRQHYRDVVLPWIGEHAPWVLEDAQHQPHVCYDESMNTGSQADIETNAVSVMKQMLPGVYRAGQNKPWAWRRDPLLRALEAGASEPMVVVDRSATLLIRAWRGMWHYEVTNLGDVRKYEPKKPNPPWADVGDASAYCIANMAPWAPQRPPGSRPTKRRILVSPFAWMKGRT